jgi:class 3 adenylate cyclase/tetratricopeptide (TPR) repeat protein
VHCSSCAAELANTARFCSECGQPQGREFPETRRIVTIVFCDLSGSTALSERVDAESLRGILLRYFDLMRSCLVRHGGTVEKYIGDAVMAVFGVPSIHEDDALRAVRAAAEMRSAVTTLNEDLAGESGVRIAVRIGVNTGEVVTAGAVDGGQVFAAGDAVNLAARLEQHAAPGEVLLGHSTYRLVSGAVEADAVAPLTVKGKAEPVRAWRLRNVRVEAGPVRRRFDVPIVGRAHELSRLALLLEDVMHGHGCHVCTVFGDPGMGKTRLAHEFVRQAEAAGALAAVAACSADDAGSLTPFRTVLARILDAVRQHTPTDLLSDAPAAAVALAGILRDGSAGTSPDETFWAVRLAVAEAARRRPLVIVLDDLQWASSTSLDLVAHLADRLRDGAVLLLCLARFELLDQRPNWGGGQLTSTTMTLRPLGTRDSLRLAGSLADVSAHLATGVVERIVAAAEGNPFFVEQTMAMYLEDGVDGIPATVYAVIAARLDLLAPSHLDWLRWAALLHRPFTVSEITELIGADARVGDEELQSLVRRRLIEPSDTRGMEVVYRFTNSQIRDVSYSTLPKKVRAERHTRIARFIAAHATAPQGTAADEEIATHLEHAIRYHAELGTGQSVSFAIGEEAAGRLQRAGRAALSRGDVPRARSLFSRALAIPVRANDPARLRTMADLADVLLAAGEAPAAGRLLGELQEEATRAGEHGLVAHGRLQLAVLHLGDQGPGQLVRTAEEALPVFEAASDRVGMARCWLRLGQVSQGSGRFDEAKHRFEHALEYARGTEARLERAMTLGGLAYCLWRGPEPASVAIQRCRELVAGNDCPSATWVAVNCPYALLLGMRRDFDDARAILSEAQRILHDQGQVTAGATVPIFVGLLEAMAGDLMAAEHAFRAARSAFGEIGDPHMADAATVHLARVAFGLGRNDEALDLLASCQNLDDEVLYVEAALAASLQAAALADNGDVDGANSATGLALALVDGLQSPHCVGTVLLDVTHALRVAGRDEEAMDAARQALDCFVRKEDLVGQYLAGSVLRAVRPE